MQPPVNSTSNMTLQGPIKASSRSVGLVAFILLTFCAVCVAGVIGIASYFRLSSDTAALRSSVMKFSSGRWDKKIAVNIGPLTMAVVRNGLRFIPMKAEPRFAIEAVRGGEAGIYTTRSQKIDTSAVLIAADKRMRPRGWDRIVTVNQDKDFVVVYGPAKTKLTGTIRCCFVVLNQDTLVVGAVRLKPGPLLALVRFEQRRNS